jgi:aspartyl aminopeptidase
MTPPTATAKQLAEKACAFLTASTDPFHAVKTSVAKLEAAGFARLQNSANFATADDDRRLRPGGKYYYTVQNSTLVAFTVGGRVNHNSSSNAAGGTASDASPTAAPAFYMIGGHTDSPNLRVKPRSKKPAKSGCVQLGVECYGGGACLVSLSVCVVLIIHRLGSYLARFFRWERRLAKTTNFMSANSSFLFSYSFFSRSLAHMV